MSPRFYLRWQALFSPVALGMLLVAATQWNASLQSAVTPAEEHPTTLTESHPAEQGEAGAGEHSGAAEHGESAAEPPSRWTPIFQGFNFLLILGAIVYAGKKYIGPFLVQRTRAIQEDMQHSARVVEEATERLSEIEDKLQRLGEEIQTLQRTALEEAGAERARIEELAQADAQKIVRAAEQEIAAAAKAARQELKVYTAELAVSLAEQKIQDSISPQTERVLFRSFVEDLTKSPAGRGNGASSGDSPTASGRDDSTQPGGGT